ncbi:AraC family transcriptional regulator [Clostridium sp.]|uniref:helix-turn-helix transcriptional regulator n=1 Tax=Clostridium sp. TaxID=1506 RepID=UPI002619A71F|nr:AraC family transcriptional regulator [Clostridium sp.]
MIFLKSALIDFYNCFEIPIRVVDNNLNILCEVGYSSFYDYIFNELNLNSKFIRSYKKHEENDSLLITFENNISFYSLLNYNSLDKNLIFIIGPLYLKENLNTSNNSELYPNIALKNKPSLKYYNKLLNIIIDDKLKDYSNASYSPYVARAIEYIEKNYYKDISISSLCLEFKINKTYFCNIFKNETGQTFINFLNNYKIEKSKELLKDLDLSLLDIAHQVGFANQSYYCTVFKKITNQTPLKYRESLFKN